MTVLLSNKAEDPQSKDSSAPSREFSFMSYAIVSTSEASSHKYEPERTFKAIIENTALGITERYLQLDSLLTRELTESAKAADQLRTSAKTDAELSQVKAAYEHLLQKGTFFLEFKERGPEYIALYDFEKSSSPALLKNAVEFMRNSNNPFTQEAIFQKLTDTTSPQEISKVIADALVGCTNASLLNRLLDCSLNKFEQDETRLFCLSALKGTQNADIQMKVCLATDKEVFGFETTRASAAAQVLNQSIEPATIDFVLSKFLRSQGPPQRNIFACWVFAGTKDPEIQAEISAVFHKRPREVHLACIRALRNPIHPAAKALLIKTARRATSGALRLEALKSLSEERSWSVNRLLRGGRNLPYSNSKAWVIAAQVVTLGAIPTLCELSPQLNQIHYGYKLLIAAGVIGHICWTHKMLKTNNFSNVFFGRQDRDETVRKQVEIMLKARSKKES